MQQIIDIYCMGGLPAVEHPHLAYHAVDAMAELPTQRHGILVLNLPASQQDSWLQTWHQAKRFYGWLIFVVNESRYSDALADGLWLPESALQAWQRLQANAEQIKVADPEPLLAWLWLGDHRRLLPVAEHQSDSLYVYPLLQALQPERDNLFHFLAQETKRGLLASEQVFDRIRQCNQCHSSHLNYLNLAPAV